MSLKKVLNEKREWRDFKNRVKQLPREYRIVYSEIEKYVYKVLCAEGVWNDEVFNSAENVFHTILEIFEEGASMNKKALEVTGEDVAAFCDKLLKA